MTIDAGILRLEKGVQLRGGKGEVLATVNPLLSEREIMIETDTGRLKIGNGLSHWNELPYYGEHSTETIYKIILTAEHISQKFLELPEDCDTSKFTGLYIQGLITEPGEDWELVERTAPDKDLIVWDGLGLENTAQIGDKVLISYYKKS